MATLRSLPQELFDDIIEYLVLTVGIQNAVGLKTVSRQFDRAIQRAIVDRQIVDILDPATPGLAERMPLTLRICIVEAEMRTGPIHDMTCSLELSIMQDINRDLDRLLNEETNPMRIQHRHQRIAAAMRLVVGIPANAQIHTQNLLSAAVILGELSLLHQLLQQNNLADIQGWTPYFPSLLELAAARGHLEIVQYLLRDRLDKSFRSSESERWHRDMLRGPIRLFPTPDLPRAQSQWNDSSRERQGQVLREGSSALRAAIAAGHNDVITFLLRDRSVRDKYHTKDLDYLRAICTSAYHGRLDVISAICATIGTHWRDFSGLGDEMLWEATRGGQLATVRELLDQGVDVDAATDNSRSVGNALQIAASRGDIQMVRLLLERGADVHRSHCVNGSAEPVTSMSIAGAQGREDIITLLAEHGADPRDALIGAAGGGQARLVDILLTSNPIREDQELAERAFRAAFNTPNPAILFSLICAGGTFDCEHVSTATELSPDGPHAGEADSSWIADYLALRGVQLPSPLRRQSVSSPFVRQVRVTKRTWLWVGR